MKAKYFFAVAAACTALIFVAVAAPKANKKIKDGEPDAQGHMLAQMWQDYNSAHSKDLPRKELSILQQIKIKARAEELSWDWYDAARKESYLIPNINWKQRDSARATFNAEARHYPDPVVGVRYTVDESYGYTELSSLISSSKKKLSQQSSPVFWEERDGGFYGVAKKYFANDYEYALWAMEDKYGINYFSQDDAESIREQFSGRYPVDAMVDFLLIGRLPKAESVSAFRSFRDAHSSQAVSMLAVQALLRCKRDSIDYLNNPKSEDYKALWEDCVEASKRLRSFSGSEPDIVALCSGIASLKASLESQSASIEINDGVVSIATRNYKSVTFSLTKNDKRVYSKRVDNPVNSFYVFDTLKFELPHDFNDGSYVARVSSGTDVLREVQYSRYSISLAYRYDSKVPCVYAADSRTGEPCQGAELVLVKNENDSEVCSMKVSCTGGFVKLDQKFIDAINTRKYYSVFVRKVDGERVRLSENLFCSKDDGTVLLKERAGGVIMTDCSAFHPGDKVKFKAIAYEGVPGTWGVFPEGRKIVMELYDASSTRVASCDLTTDKFGAVSGEFNLPSGKKMGSWRLDMRYEKQQLTSKRIVVDEYELPNYELHFDKVDKMYFPGDTVKISGKVASYSGHSLSSAQIKWEVKGRYWNRGSSYSRSGECGVASDGSFSFDFDSEKVSGDMYYIVSVLVIDATGEALPFDKEVHIEENPSVRVAIDNMVYMGNAVLVSSDTLGVSFSYTNCDGVDAHVPIEWELVRNGVSLSSGKSTSGSKVFIPMPQGAAEYELFAQGKRMRSFLKLSDTDKFVDADCVEGVCRKLSDGISFQIASCGSPLWAVVELYGASSELLRSEIIHLAGVRRESSSLISRKYEYLSSYPDDVTLRVFWFKGGKNYSEDFRFRKEDMSRTLPLEVTRFSDSAYPSSQVNVSLKSSPSAQCALTVFDKSTEAVSENVWSRVSLSEHMSSAPYYSSVLGRDSGRGRYLYYSNDIMYSKASGMASAPARSAVAMDGAVLMREESVAQESAAVPVEEIVIHEPFCLRSDFRTSIAFAPCLEPDADGNVSYSFKTSDKLSTFCMNVFAHDKSMRTATLRKELVVTLPVELSMVQPSFLYEGDSYMAALSLSSVVETPVAGTLSLSASDVGGGVLSSCSERVALKGKGSYSTKFGVEVPVGVDSVEIVAKFVADQDSDGRVYSDAVKVTIPVKKRVQSLVEAYSKVLLSGTDREAALKDLLASFVNTSSEGASVKDITIRDMVADAVSQRKEPKSDNAISVVDALYCNILAQALRNEGVVEGSGAEGGLIAFDPQMVVRLLACHNSDGGFAWFKGFDSSPYVTAIVLERLASLRERDLMPKSELSATITSAVRYLDTCFKASKGSGWLWQEDYLYVRSFFPEVSVDFILEKSLRKYAKSYLNSKSTSSGGSFFKARRLTTLANLYYKKGGIELAKSFGVSLSTSKKIESTIKADILSLSEYAVRHSSGAFYYPNAVMPFRGLMESELYAHSMICDILRRYAGGEFAQGASEDALGSVREISDGLAIWLMLQKETQKWNDDPACLEAIASVYASSPEVLATKVLVVSKEFDAQIDSLKAAGNGFRLERKYFREGASEPLSEGDTLRVGEKIVAKYKIWNEENRSFVKLTVPFPACLRPIDQFSGRVGWFFRRVAWGLYSYTPQGYRSSYYDRSEYWYDLFPEENTEITEEFRVSQTGCFSSSVATIESVYAPHYRANGAWDGKMSTH